jgi:hypothetical protein
MEPDYLPDAEVFRFQPCLYPSEGSGAKPLKQKLPYKSIL